MRTGVTFSIEDSLIQRIFDQAMEKCQGNVMDFGGRRVLIEGGGYRKIWLETQPMGGEMFAKVDLDVAMNNQRLFMEHQRQDGRLPGSIAYMDGQVIPQYDKFQGFCFPFPALNMYYWTGGGDTAYLQSLRDALERFDAYLWRVRDSDGDGCLESWCVFDTGDDNCAKYGDAPVYCTEDTPPVGYANVPMESSDVMSFSYSARETLAKISRLLGDGKEADWLKKADAVRQRMREYLWDEEIGALFDRDSRNQPIPALTHHTLRAMYWHSLADDMAERFLKEHLFNPEEFWTPMPLPSIAANNPYFRNNAHNDWSGQPQGLTYQRAIRALENYGHYAEVLPLGQKLLQAVGMECQFTQQFDPFTATPSVVVHDGQLQHNYGPTMLACLEYIARTYGISIIEGEMHFGAQGDTDASYTLAWGEKRFLLKSQGGVATAWMDDRELFSLSGRARVVTTADGKINRLIGTQDGASLIKLQCPHGRMEREVKPNETIDIDI